MLVHRNRYHEFKVQLRAWGEAHLRLPKDDNTSLTATWRKLRNQLRDFGDEIENYFPTPSAFRQFGYDHREEVQDALSENAETYPKWPVTRILNGYCGRGDMGGGPTKGTLTSKSALIRAEVEELIDHVVMEVTPGLNCDARRREREIRSSEREQFVVRTLEGLVEKIRSIVDPTGRSTLISRTAAIIISEVQAS